MIRKLCDDLALMLSAQAIAMFCMIGVGCEMEQLIWPIVWGPFMVWFMRYRADDGK